jgi:hypothetical protein
VPARSNTCAISAHRGGGEIFPRRLEIIRLGCFYPPPSLFFDLMPLSLLSSQAPRNAPPAAREMRLPLVFGVALSCPFVFLSLRSPVSQQTLTPTHTTPFSQESGIAECIIAKQRRDKKPSSSPVARLAVFLFVCLAVLSPFVLRRAFVLAEATTTPQSFRPRPAASDVC